MILVFGAGISGIGVKELLESKGKEVLIVDDKIGNIDTDAGIKLLEDENIEYIVKSPGISFETLFIRRAISKNINIYSEIDIAYEYMNKDIEIIAFTGTNGKTTTSTKFYELLLKAGFNVELCGNVGKSFSSVVKENRNLDYIVLELSSYQLENNPRIKPKIAGIINLNPDHLGRYKNEKDYYLTKFNIFKNQNKSDYMIVNTDDINVLSMSKEAKKTIDNYTCAKRIYISKKELGNIFINNDKIYVMKNIFERFSPKFNIESQADYLINVRDLSLKGEHNLENMLFLIAAAKIIEIPNKVIRNFLKEAKSIEHRCEVFFKKDNSVFVNDSKGTNIDSTIKAISSYDNEIILICGGEDKKLSFRPLVEEIKKRVKKVYIYGENKYLLKEELEKWNYKEYLVFDNLLEVVSNLSKEDFNKEKTILFSPATSSFDQFKNFEERGKYFKETVIKILGDSND